MNITSEMLQNMDACEEGIQWFKKQKITDLKELCIKAKKERHFDWVAWLISKLLTRENCIKYTIFAAESVLDVFEKEYPNDDRPRKAIEATKAYVNNPSKENKVIIMYAATAANAARTANSACNATIANSACNATNAAACAAISAHLAANSVYNAATAAYNVIGTQIVMYGVQLIEKQEIV